MEMFMGSSTEAPFSDTAWPKSCGHRGLGSAGVLSSPGPRPTSEKTSTWVLKATYLILDNLLPVQWHSQQQPACLLLYSEDTLRGTVCSRPSDAVENLGASVLIRFELETNKQNDS